MEFKSTGLNYTKEEIETNGNQVPLGKLHDEVCDYMESEWKASESEILNISTALWKALEVLNNELIKKDEQFKNEEECWLITVNARDERIKELENHISMCHEKISRRSTYTVAEVSQLESKYQESVKDIDWMSEKMLVQFDCFFPVNRERVLEIKSKYGLDKQEGES